ncbi:MAG: DUF3053 domain-containing protein [Azoarcus sp.]|nr:DUF3053 domain-containing protein [Azoarcus sp.]
MSIALPWDRTVKSSIITRVLVSFVALLAVFTLAGCGGNEPEERNAFITFLQTRILDKPGLAVPAMNAENKKAFGSYAAHYQIILDFNASMNEATKFIGEVNGLQVKFNSLQGLQDNWQELTPLRAKFPEIEQTLTSELHKAQTARDALKQPDDLKPVYDQAFAKTVTDPAEAFKNVLPAMVKSFQAMEDLGHFLSDNKSRIEISGTMLGIQDPALQNQFEKLNDKYMTEAQSLVEAYQALASMR